jgi:hypothetical protein
MPRLSETRATRNPALRIAPVRRIAFVDVVQLWLQRPLSPRQRAWLERRCYFVRVDYFQLRVRIVRPSGEAVQWLATRKHGLNYVELALDWEFNSETERDAAALCVRNNAVHRWHRARRVREVWEDRGTRSTAERDAADRHGDQHEWNERGVRYTAAEGAPSNLVIYADRRSRMTGAPFCVHLEWRLYGGRVLRRAGIGSLSDLLRFDHRRFWSKRLQLRAVNLRKLGRLHCVRVQRKGPRRGPWIEHDRGLLFAFDYHARTGTALLLTCRVAGSNEVGTTQVLIDEWREKWPDKFDISDCLVPLDVRHLLPTEQVWWSDPPSPVADDGSTELIIDDRCTCQTGQTRLNPLRHQAEPAELVEPAAPPAAVIARRPIQRRPISR